MNRKAATPRIPPPSTQRTPAPAVGGYIRISTSFDITTWQRKHFVTLYTQGSSTSGSPNTTTQFSQIAWPQSKANCGSRLKHERQVLLLFMPRQRSLKWQMLARWTAADGSASREDALANFSNCVFTFAMNPLRRTTSLDCSNDSTRFALTLLNTSSYRT